MINITDKDISPLEAIYDIIHYWLQKEIREDGLLSDVSLLINSSARYDHLDAPLLWIEKQEVTTTVINHSNQMSLKVPVSIICCDEVIDTETEAEASALNLACRCITAMYLNITNPRPMGKCVTLRDFRIERVYPHIPTTGSFDITSKSMMMAASRVDVVFTFEVDWMVYETLYDDEHALVDYSIYADDSDLIVTGELPDTVTVIRPKQEYSPIDHRHDDLYAQLVHYHDERYSLLNHRHDDLYSSVNHQHDTRYSLVNHTHSQYATKLELESAIGSKHTHNNVLYVSPFRVTGELVYIQCEVEASHVMILEDLNNEIFTVSDIRGLYVFLEQEGADPDQLYHLLYYSVLSDEQQDTFLNVNNVTGNPGETVDLYSLVSDKNNAPIDEGEVDYSLEDKP